MQPYGTGTERNSSSLNLALEDEQVLVTVSWIGCGESVNNQNDMHIRNSFKDIVVSTMIINDPCPGSYYFLS